MDYCHINVEKLLRLQLRQEIEVRLIGESGSKHGYGRVYEIVGYGTIDVKGVFDENEPVPPVSEDIIMIKELFKKKKLRPRPYGNMQNS